VIPLQANGATEKGRVRLASTRPAIDRTSATDAAARELRALILSRELPAGALLHQGELARQLGLSRTPLREALQRLSAEGLVRIDPHRGAVVAQPTIGEVNQIYELQMMLEAAASRAAVANATPDGLAGVGEALRQHEASGASADWVESNRAFHTSIYGLANRPLMLEMIGMLRNRAAIYVNLLARSDEGRARADREHHEMLEALRRGDADRIETLVRQHLQRTLDWLQTVIEQ
jgi:DNA-binding GntR family transcriptional regulator